MEFENNTEFENVIKNFKFDYEVFNYTTDLLKMNRDKIFMMNLIKIIYTYHPSSLPDLFEYIDGEHVDYNHLIQFMFNIDYNTFIKKCFVLYEILQIICYPSNDINYNLIQKELKKYNKTIPEDFELLLNKRRMWVNDIDSFY